MKEEKLKERKERRNNEKIKETRNTGEKEKRKITRENKILKTMKKRKER